MPNPSTVLHVTPEFTDARFRPYGKHVAFVDRNNRKSRFLNLPNSRVTARISRPAFENDGPCAREHIAPTGKHRRFMTFNVDFEQGDFLNSLDDLIKSGRRHLTFNNFAAR